MGSSTDCKNSPNVRQQTFQRITTPKTCSPWADHVGGSESVAEKSSMKKTQAIKAIIGTIQEDIVNDGRPDLVQSFKDYSVFAAA